MRHTVRTVHNFERTYVPWGIEFYEPVVCGLHNKSVEVGLCELHYSTTSIPTTTTFLSRRFCCKLRINRKINKIINKSFFVILCYSIRIFFLIFFCTTTSISVPKMKMTKKNLQYLVFSFSGVGCW